MEITKKNPDNSWWLRAGPDNEENWGVEGEHRWLVIQRQLHLVLIICLWPFGKYKLNVENWAMIVSSCYHCARPTFLFDDDTGLSIILISSSSWGFWTFCWFPALQRSSIWWCLYSVTFFMPLEAGRRPKRRIRNFFISMFWLRWFILLTVMSNK